MRACFKHVSFIHMYIYIHIHTHVYIYIYTCRPEARVVSRDAVESGSVGISWVVDIPVYEAQMFRLWEAWFGQS